MSKSSVITINRTVVLSLREQKMHKLSLALRDTGMAHRDQVFLLQRVEHYPWLATAQISVKPPTVPGDHMSAVGRKGFRVWGFQTMKERDDFVAHRGGSLFP